MMRAMISSKAVIACLSVLAVTGCGLKGPLYLPDKQQSVPAEHKDGEKKSDDKKSAPQSTDTAPSATPAQGGAADGSVK